MAAERPPGDDDYDYPRWESALMPARRGRLRIQPSRPRTHWPVRLNNESTARSCACGWQPAGGMAVSEFLMAHMQSWLPQWNDVKLYGPPQERRVKLPGHEIVIAQDAVVAERLLCECSCGFRRVVADRGQGVQGSPSAVAREHVRTVVRRLIYGDGRENDGRLHE